MRLLVIGVVLLGAVSVEGTCPTNGSAGKYCPGGKREAAAAAEVAAAPAHPPYDLEYQDPPRAIAKREELAALPTRPPYGIYDQDPPRAMAKREEIEAAHAPTPCPSWDQFCGHEGPLRKRSANGRPDNRAADLIKQAPRCNPRLEACIPDKENPVHELFFRCWPAPYDPKDGRCHGTAWPGKRAADFAIGSGRPDKRELGTHAMPYNPCPWMESFMDWRTGECIDFDPCNPFGSQHPVTGKCIWGPHPGRKRAADFASGSDRPNKRAVELGSRSLLCWHRDPLTGECLGGPWRKRAADFAIGSDRPNKREAELGSRIQPCRGPGCIDESWRKR